MTCGQRQAVHPLWDLLTDFSASEKEIAAEIGRTTCMTHKYIMEIFRKFGVNGRAGLMAIWLGNPKATPS